MRTTSMTLGLVIAAAGVPVAAQDLIVLPPDYLVTDLSEDGAVGVGNLYGPFETFRYEWGGSPVLLGRGTVATLGTGAGSPDISYDGAVISATVLNQAENLQTMGVWTEGGGWVTLETVPHADALSIDNSWTSCWSLSGDGRSVGGFFWYSRPGEFGSNPCVWTPADGGVERLSVDFDRSGRVNGLNFDGSVRVGWEEASTGAWQPTVWRQAAKHRLADDGVPTTCEDVTADGGTVVGDSFVVATQNRAATAWRWDGSGYSAQVLGQLPGTPAFNGWSVATDVSDDGAIILGTNYYSLSPGGNADAFVWTPESGLMEAGAYLASRGVTVSGIDLREATAVSPDGSTMAFIGVDLSSLRLRTVLVRFPDACGADFDANGVLDFFDVSAFLAMYNASDAGADLDDNGAFNFFDVAAFLALYGEGCG